MKIISIIAVFIIAASSLTAQYRGPKPLFANHYKRIYSEIVCLPMQNSDSIKAITFIRVPYKSLLFKTNQETQLKDQKYICSLSVEISYKNSENIIKSRVLKKDVLYLPDNSEEFIKEMDYITSIESVLPAEDFKADVEVNDDSKNPVIIEKLMNINAAKMNTDEMIYDPIYVENHNSSLFPVILDSAFNYKPENMKIIIPVTTKNPNSVFNFEINKIPGESSKIKSFTLSTSKELKGNISQQKESISISSYDNNFISLKPEAKNDLYYSYLIIDVPAENVLPGNYELKISEKGKALSSVFNFQVIWRYQPFSLNNPEKALEIMYYVLTDEEYNKMKSVDENDIYDEIFKYWQSKFPNSPSNYNYALAEYFIRVDEAEKDYKTNMEQYGAKTERGKIHILYGEPDSIVSQPKSSNTLEIWKYNKIKKEFHFETTPTGIYKLTDIIEIN